MTRLPAALPFPQILRSEEVDAREAERAILAALYAQHGPRVHRFLRDLLGDPALAADATQETFARAFHLFPEVLRDRERAAPWLFGVARNVSLELRKARGRAGKVFVREPTDGEGHAHAHAHADPSPSPETELLGHEAARIVAAALAKLSEDRRALLLLRMDHGLSYDEIATSLGFTLAKVKVELHRAREVLRETFRAYADGAADTRGGAR